MYLFIVGSDNPVSESISSSVVLLVNQTNPLSWIVVSWCIGKLIFCLVSQLVSCSMSQMVCLCFFQLMASTDWITGYLVSQPVFYSNNQLESQQDC